MSLGGLIMLIETTGVAWFVLVEVVLFPGDPPFKYYELFRSFLHFIILLTKPITSSYVTVFE